jgi:ornithine carbamoyltransferase
MFQGRSLLKEIDFTQAELAYLIDFCHSFKSAQKTAHPPPVFGGQKHRPPV